MLDALHGTGRRIPEWMSLDANQLTARILSIPPREQIDTDVEES